MSNNDINNIIDKDILLDNMSFLSFYIALYENFTELIKDRIKSFLCTKFTINKEGEIEYEESVKYKKEIVNRIVDNKGNKDIIKSSFLWFVDIDAISMKEYDRFLEMKKQRNRFTHKMSDILLSGNTEDEIVLLT